MTKTTNKMVAKKFIASIKRSKLTIYDSIKIGDTKLWISTPILETILNQELKGLSLDGLPLRTRSKKVKEHVCKALGYPIPKSFKKTKPRFPGQQLDTYTQKSNNLQIWNDEISPSRRYAIIRICNNNKITRVKVISGNQLEKLDTTGTLTQKYQARLIPSNNSSELITNEDTNLLKSLIVPKKIPKAFNDPTSKPKKGELLPINFIFNKLKKLIGSRFIDKGYDQERIRGADLHRLVCKQLNYSIYLEDGKFPDIRHQLLEVKLQTSPTIDLGLVCPDSTEPLLEEKIENHQIRHCDVRYALFYAQTTGQEVTLTHLFITTGEKFFNRFPKFQGMVLNKKLQIPLPVNFFGN